MVRELSHHIWPPLHFNLLANASVARSERSETRPDLRDLKLPVLLLLGECSYVPRGIAMDYFDVYQINRSNVFAGVGHVIWGNSQGQARTRAAILSFVDGTPTTEINQPTLITHDTFIADGR